MKFIFAVRVTRLETGALFLNTTGATVTPHAYRGDPMESTLLPLFTMNGINARKIFNHKKNELLKI